MANIPIIDISDANHDAARQLFDAATDSGFVFIKPNKATGISVQDIDTMFDLSKAFFAAPTAVKSTCAINSASSGKNRGWLGMHGETLDPGRQKRGDFKEAFNFSALDPPQPLAGALAPARGQLLAFQAQCHALCLRILGLFGAALGTQPAGWFVERHDSAAGDTGSVLRLLFYPGLPGEVKEGLEEGVDVRAGAHSDYGSVTLLFQRRGQPGLEIWNTKGEWESVPVDPLGNTAHGEALPILVNIGDVLSYWTNGLLKSTVHRVIFPRPNGTTAEQQDRYSMAYFCHPLDDAELVPVPSKVVESLSGSEDAKKEMEKVKGLSGGKVMTARDHLNARLGATYDLPS